MTSRVEPPVSVCLLTYNRASALPRSLDSLLMQTYRNFELIINDDCSSDETQDICSDYAARDPRVRYCRNEKNLRYAGNQNAAMSRARHEFVAIVHDGDIYRGDCIQRWVTALLEHPAAAIAFNASDAIDERGVVVTQHRHPYPAHVRGLDLLDDMFRVYSSPIFGIVMLRKSAICRTGEFNESYPILADVDMWMRLLLEADAAYINEPLYKIHPREEQHVNRGVNWRIIAEQHQIFLTNAKRRFATDRTRSMQAQSRLNQLFRSRVLRSILWAFRHRQWKLALGGLKLLLAQRRGTTV